LIEAAMSMQRWAKQVPPIANSYRAGRRFYRTLFRFFPLSWLNYVRLGRTQPIAREFGLGRGSAIDRYYIERFIERHRADIHGRVLEIRDNSYTGMFGNGVAVSDVLDLSATNPIATIIGDLTDPTTLPPETFDCAIVTQTLQLIYDTRAAVESLHSALKPGGVLLVTVPGISKIATPTAVEGEGLYHDCWRFTRFSVAKLFRDVFGPDRVAVEPFGNVLAAVAFLHGLSKEEIGPRRLDRRDNEYDFLIAVRAVKSAAG
jgi:SAM-dependent methyltransferase